MPPPPSVPKLPLLFLLCLALRTAAQAELQILLDFKSSLQLTNSTEVYPSWSPDNSPCEFSGVTCNSTGYVTEINLTNTNISGVISFTSLCQLPALSKLSLGSNNLYGNISQDLRNCTRLQTLDLAFNSLAGVVPDLSSLVNLKLLNLSDNLFSGKFPWNSLANLKKLQVLSLGDNGFDPRPFPMVVVNLPYLSWLYLSNCNLNGRIPPEIGNLSNLVNLELADNFFSGEIPQEITKLTSLWQLELYNNSLVGELPTGFRKLTELAFFDASMNRLEGDLSELRYLSKLVSLQLFQNHFSGEIPSEFGDFKYLVNFSLYENRLSGELPAKLGSWAEFNFIDVSTNNLTGKIPPDMCKMGTMKKLLILQNKFTGEIPASYGNCTTLIRFRVSENLLSGVVPHGIWGLPNVDIIDLGKNQFEGPITADIARAKTLSQFWIAVNKFSGEIPPAIAGATALVKLDASFNKFSGEIPVSIGELKQLNYLALEGNDFSGDIPGSLGLCSSLVTLNLAGNSFTGEIPESLGALPNLNSLNLSSNQLAGAIPNSLSSPTFSSLDLSQNRLSGEIPVALSISAYSNSFEGNVGLCSDNSDISSLRRCLSESGRRTDKLRDAITALLVCTAVLLLAFGVVVLIKKKQWEKRNKRLRRESWDMKSFRVLSFDEQEIINSIKQENLIGKGGSGNVYRAELAGGKVVAVKHLLSTTCGGGKETAAMLGDKAAAVTKSKEFEAEVGTLSSIRHVNVVKLYCAITSEDSSMLVYEYLPNGSLWERLHGEENTGGDQTSLTWVERVEVALGAAKGLEYLHHGCDRPIVHRDVKSSNILLDEDLKPRIADFGLAKMLHAAARDSTTAHVVAGTHGYIAPEYAYTWKVNEKSDVYSFGVVLMELVTGRRPIEHEYGENKDIVYWICGRMTSRESVFALVDPQIPDYYREDAVGMLRIAVLCTARLPAMRPSMRTVVQMLEESTVIRFAPVIDVKKIDNGGFTLDVKGSNQNIKQSPGS